MTGDDDRIGRLVQLAGLRNDRDMSTLAQARQARDASLAKLRTLDKAAAKARETPAGNADTGSILAREKFALFVQRERTGLNTDLAQKNAIWLDCQAEAARSFGRVGALEKIAARAKSRRQLKLRRSAE